MDIEYVMYIVVNKYKYIVVVFYKLNKHLFASSKNFYLYSNT